jgi:hypothetical protein
VVLKNKILVGIDLGPDAPDIIQHGLGRMPTGWQIVDRTSGAKVWRVGWDKKSITLQSDEIVTVAIMVY